MRINLEAESQEEFDEKRMDLIKTLAGTRFTVSIRPRGESLPGEPRAPKYQAQKEILARAGADFYAMLEEIKAEIGAVLDE